ncbi:MAG TPA: PAS domain-containing protein [Chitinophagaceae bacterium]|nr:PAS domain-containing protein [Chitinophagaceae bacterium]
MKTDRHGKRLNDGPGDIPNHLQPVPPGDNAVERQLREANSRLLNLTRATSDAIWEWDMQTGEIFRNEQLLDMIGYPIEVKKGLSWWLHRIHPEDRNRVSDKVKDTTEKNLQSWEDEYRFKCGNGTYKYVRDRGFVIYENGLPVRMIGAIQDISNLKELEELLMEEILRREKEVSETVIRVQEDERTRIGHEMHDNVNQILSTTMLFAQMLKPSGAEQKNLREKCIEYLRLAIEEIRKLSKELVVPELKESGLVKSIESLIHDIHLSTSTRVKFTHDHECDLASTGKRVMLFRIVQEQLKNILKYAEAPNAEILLQRKNEHIELTIKDDGKGFDTDQASRGIGLSNIRQRARFYNGVVDIMSAPGRGCCLHVSIPDHSIEKIFHTGSP